MVKTTLVTDIDPLKLGRFIDRRALFMQHWRFRRAGAEPGEWNHRIAVELEPMLSARMAEYCARGVFRPAAVMAVFPTVADGDTMVLLDNGLYRVTPFRESDGAENDTAGTDPNRKHAGVIQGIRPDSGFRPPSGFFDGAVPLIASVFSIPPVARFPFPRLADGTCVTDYVRRRPADSLDLADALEPANAIEPSDAPGSADRTVASFPEAAPLPTGWFAATLGPAVAETEAELKASGRFEEYHLLHGLGAALAEALAEEIHRRLRIELGVAQYDAATPAEIIRGGYRGRRLSFGYSCCPDLSLQATLIQLLDTSRIGLTLSPTFQMVPELSVSALVLV